MIVARHERNVIRVSPSGDIVIPKDQVAKLLNRRGTSGIGLAEDLKDFGPGRILVLGTVTTDSGTAIDIRRDLRQEAKPATKRKGR